MKLTDYYKMVKLPNCRSKYRFDCIESTGKYEPFEDKARKTREGRFKCYYSGVPNSFNEDVHRRADTSITDSDNISSVFCPDLDNPLLGYGDTAGTDDALLFIFNPEYTQIEIFVARGMKRHQRGLFALLVDGELDEEIEKLRGLAEPTF